MNIDVFRQKMASYRAIVDAEAKTLKDSYLALDRLHTLYENFDEDEQTLADEVISEWALSEDEGLRFDALALIDDFGIVNAVPTLRKLIDHLKSSSTPSAPYDLKKVNRIIARLKFNGVNARKA